MPEMNDILILDDGEPVRLNRGVRRHAQTVILLQNLQQFRDEARDISPERRGNGTEFRNPVRAVQITHEFSDGRPHRSIEWKRNRLPLDRVKDAQAHVGHRGGLCLVFGVLPQKRAVRLPLTRNVLAEMRP